MANANVAIINTSNTFQDWMIRDNNIANSINELRNGNYYKDNGGFTIANGALVISGGSGTLLSVSGNVTISQQITSNTILNFGDLTVQGNNVLFTSNTNIVNIANSLVVSNTVTIGANTSIAGNLSVTKNTTISGNISVTNNVTIGGDTNITGNMVSLGTGTSNIGGLLNVASQLITPLANITTANINNLSLSANLSVAGTLTAPTIKLISNGAFTIINGDAVLNNLTVQGTQTIVGSVVNASDTMVLRYNIPTDGDGHIVIQRGSTAGNTDLKLNSSANVLQFAANASQTYSTVLTTANIIDTLVSSSTTDAASANAVKSAMVQANVSANLVAIYANDTLSMANANINFNNTSSINISVSANATNKRANVSFAANLAYLGSNIIPPGSNTQILYNDNGLLGDTSNFTFDKANNTLYVANNIGIGQSTPKANLDVNGFARANSHQDHYANNGTITGNVTIDCRLGGFFDLTLASSTSNITLQNCATTGNVTTIQIMLRQTANGSNTVAWVNTIKWSDNTQPVLTTTANTADVIQLSTFNGGTIWIGAQVYANIPAMNSASTYS